MNALSVVAAVSLAASMGRLTIVCEDSLSTRISECISMSTRPI